jgi:hypothetical protein
MKKFRRKSVHVKYSTKSKQILFWKKKIESSRHFDCHTIRQTLRGHSNNTWHFFWLSFDPPPQCAIGWQRWGPLLHVTLRFQISGSCTIFFWIFFYFESTWNTIKICKNFTWHIGLPPLSPIWYVTPKSVTYYLNGP